MEVRITDCERARHSLTSQKALGKSDRDSQDIIRRTSSVIFLATPQRGSPGTSFQDIAHSVMDVGLSNNSTMFNVRFLSYIMLPSCDFYDNTDRFCSLWKKYGFCVKTFQEGLSLSLPRLGSSAPSMVCRLPPLVKHGGISD